MQVVFPAAAAMADLTKEQARPTTPHSTIGLADGQARECRAFFYCLACENAVFGYPQRNQAYYEEWTRANGLFDVFFGDDDSPNESSPRRLT